MAWQPTGVAALAGPAPNRHAGCPPALLTGFVVAMSATAALLISFVGTAGAVVFLSLWLLLAITYGRASLHCLIEGPLLVWLLPGTALLSTLWSEAPVGTLRFGIEYVVTIGCAVLAGSLLKPRSLIVALVLAFIAIALISLAYGREGVDPLTGVVTFVGIFESKNQLGLVASLLLLGAITLVLDTRQSGPIRLMGCGAGLLALPLIVMSRSATSVASVVLAVAVLLLGLFASRLDRFGRSRALFAAFVLAMLALLLIVASGTDTNGFILGVLGRNSTLTGRTYLWSFAAQIIGDDPLLGRGYQAFWLRDSVNAESLWHEFHVASGAGFSFHNAYVEMAVELGYVGVAVLAVTLAGIFIGVLRWSWDIRSVPAAFFVALMVCMLVRSVAEVDFTGPFALGTFILGVTATYAATKPREEPRYSIPNG
jgi:exopolysaccharide production protein ExoQ